MATVWFNRIRPLILVLAGIWAIAWALVVSQVYASPDLQIIRLVQGYALTVLGLLYLVLIISPLTMMWPTMPGRLLVIRARRALGVSAFGFAALHASFAFFRLLGGFSGWAFLATPYRTGMLLGLTALIIVTIMAATSFDTISRKLGRRWKMIHRLVYLAALLITIHALMLGSHFADLSRLIPRIFMLMLAILLWLQAWRLDRWLRKPNQQPAAVGWPMVVLALIIGYGFAIGMDQHHSTLGIHQHSQTELAPTTTYSTFIDEPLKLESKKSLTLVLRIVENQTAQVATRTFVEAARRIDAVIINSEAEVYEHVAIKKAEKLQLNYRFVQPGEYSLVLMIRLKDETVQTITNVTVE